MFGTPTSVCCCGNPQDIEVVRVAVISASGRKRYNHIDSLCDQGEVVCRMSATTSEGNEKSVLKQNLTKGTPTSVLK
jgi:hypothetical protein